MNKEKVIIRREYDPYMKLWKYLCIFPESYEGNGTYGCVSLWKNEYGQWVHEPYTSGAVSYFYKCKLIHKNNPEIEEVLKGLKFFYDEEYQVVEKIMH